jgi:LacI family transcriptional regulator, repressor for deo operon, udp, cdd, tsx, nupC, and nupG
MTAPDREREGLTTGGAPRAPGTATVHDVAVRAGVSVATVSRALRGLPNVAPATRARVLEAAAELRYRPDPNASRLAAGRSHAIGIAMPFVGQWYFAQVLAGVEAVLAGAGYDLLVYTAATPKGGRRFLADALPVRKRVDGLILVDLPLLREEVGAWADSGVRLVAVGQRTGPYPWVGIDDEAAAHLAVSHLLDLGHRHVGLIGAAPPGGEDFGLTVPAARQAGYERALTERGIPVRPELTRPAAFDVGLAAAAMEQLLRGPVRPTAVFATSDEMALGAIGTARSLELDVPGDVSVVGFDDHDLAAAVGLTTIRQSPVDIGSWAAELLLDELRTGVVEPRHVVAPVELVVRSTTAPP